MSDSPDDSGVWSELALEALARSTDLLVVADSELRIRFVSAGSRELLGYEPGDVMGRNGIEFFHPDDAELFAQVASRALLGYVPRSPIFYRLIHSDGSVVTLELSGGPLREKAGERRVRAFWLVGRRPARAEIYAEVLQRLLAGEPLDIALENVGPSMIPDVGPRFCICLWRPGNSPVSIGDHLPDVLSGAERRPGTPWDEVARTAVPCVARPAGELDAQTAAVAEREGLDVVSVIPVRSLDAVVVGALTLWTPPGYPHAGASAAVLERTRDLVEAAVRLREQIDQLTARATSDPLTGLANRRAIEDALRRVDDNLESSVLYLDLDAFKQVNDTHGHAIGDELLAVVGRRIRSLVRAGDLVGRLGGDEFVVVCRDCGPGEATALSERILEGLRYPILISGLSITISASIGVSSGLGVDLESLKRADRALYQAKKAGRDTSRHQ